MKTLLLTAMALSISTSVFAGNLNENALTALLTSKDTYVTGDVHSYESFKTIYKSAVQGGAKIVNECTVVSSDTAKCTLWLTYELGETAVQYYVDLPGHTLSSSRLDVSRGD